MKKLFTIILILASIQPLFAEKYSDYLKRHKIFFGYEEINFNYDYTFDGKEIPNRISRLSLRTFGLHLGYYFPVYFINPNMSVGLDPKIGLLSGGKSQRTENYGYNYTDPTDDGGFSVAGFKFSGFLQLKYMADATINSANSDLGAGLGIGYYYFYPLAIIEEPLYGPLVNAEITYMFGKHTGLSIRGTMPIVSYKIDNININSYSLTLALIGIKL